MTLAVLIAFFVRLLLVGLFLPFSALDKVRNFEGAVGQATGIGISRGVGAALICVGLFVEVVMSLGVLTGAADRLAAFILAGYCVATALLYKRFWAEGDFAWRGASRGRDLFWDFMKNFALAGGFLLITFGTTAPTTGAFFADPLSSTHPYASVPIGAQP
ncbi:MAG: DoxX family membrane protein [Geminicoccaceae bacterium]|nr:DoxX family membrane protein [Geminicoccaceae bacterium]